MRLNNKRGLSPIIASVLLILIVMVLAALIFIWAKGFVSEKVLKFNEVIENSCKNVNMKAEAYGGKVHISNDGTVPIYGLEIIKKSLGSSSGSGVQPFDSTVVGGLTGAIDLPSSVKEGDSISVLPVLLGESGNNKKSYTCSDNGKDLVVDA